MRPARLAYPSFFTRYRSRFPLLLALFFFILSNQFSLPLSWTHLSPSETFFISRCSVRNFGSPIILYHIIFYLSINSSLGRIIYSSTFIISKIFYGVKCPVAKNVAPIKLYHKLKYKSNSRFARKVWRSFHKKHSSFDVARALVAVGEQKRGTFTRKMSIWLASRAFFYHNIIFFNKNQVRNGKFYHFW